MGQVIGGRYVAETEVGFGGMGTVYRGTDRHTGQTVAIKRLKSDIVTPDLMERFRREGDALRDLNHPNIIRLLDALEDQQQHYLVMEYIPGDYLSRLLKQERLAVDRILHFAIDLADALTRAHRLNIIHRDLKPANILIASDGTLRLSDFGVAYLSGRQRVTDSDMIVGTIDYLAPETLNGEHVDTLADVWAFGVIVFEMVSGQHPFAAGSMTETIRNILIAPLPDIEKLRPDASSALVDLVYRIVDAVFDNHEEMLEIHPAAAATIPGNFVHNSFLPYHDGAIRYYGNTLASGVLAAD